MPLKALKHVCNCKQSLGYVIRGRCLLMLYFLFYKQLSEVVCYFVEGQIERLQYI